MFEEEIQKTKNEREMIQATLLAQQVSFANKMRNGLKDEIIKSLEKPYKPTLWERIKWYLKTIFNFRKKVK